MLRPGGRPAAVNDTVWPAGADTGGTLSSTGLPARLSWPAGAVTVSALPTCQVTPIEPSTSPSAAAVTVLTWAAAVAVGRPETTPAESTASPAGRPDAT